MLPQDNTEQLIDFVPASQLPKILNHIIRLCCFIVERNLAAGLIRHFAYGKKLTVSHENITIF